MKSILIAIAALLASTFFASQGIAEEAGETKVGGGITYQTDGGWLGIEARGLYYFTDRIALQPSFNYIIVQENDNATTFDFVLAGRYDLVQMKKLDFYANVGYQYVYNVQTILNQDFDASFSALYGAVGVEIPVSSFTVYGEIAFPYTITLDNNTATANFKVGVYYPL
ncbi:MAG: hypothetical protein Kapaf2KO_17060 [Candidatus Kapaibacteriales bacterium]